MKSTPIFIATTIVASIVAGYLWKQLDGERQRTARLQARVLQLEVSQVHMTGSLPATKPLQTDGPPVPAGAPVAAIAAPRSNPPVRNTAGTQTLLQDSGYRAARLAQLRMQIPRNYPGLAKELGLTPEQANAFFDLLAQQQLDLMTDSIGNEVDGADRQQALRARSEHVQAQQLAVQTQLGAEKYQQYQQYQQTLPVRRQVEDFGTTLTAAGYPLTDEQKQPLLDSMISGQKQIEDDRAHNGPVTDPRDQIERMQEDLKAQEESNQRTLAAAQSYLSAQQLATLRSSMDSQVNMRRAVLNRQRAVLEAGTN